jgi:hypothetical protein
MTNFLTDYIATRHPNSPAYRYMVTEATRLIKQADRHIRDYPNVMYCLGEGIIQPADLPADMVAI